MAWSFGDLGSCCLEVLLFPEACLLLPPATERARAWRSYQAAFRGHAWEWLTFYWKERSVMAAPDYKEDWKM